MKYLAILILLTGIVHSPKQVDSLRRVHLGELFVADDKEGFLEACRDLIDYHATHNNEKQLFDAYATLFDRLQMWGRYDEAVATLEEMSAEVQHRDSDLGSAITAFCFGQLYLGNRQPQEAETHYRRAFRSLMDLGENGRALRAGFNLQAIAMNLDDPAKGLAINDSTDVLLKRIEEMAGRSSPNNRLKQVRYRFVLLQRLDRFAEASPLKDTLLYYATLMGDPGQDEIVLTALAQYEQAVGQRDSAYARLDTLIARNLRNQDWQKVARFRLALADFQRDNGDLAQAVDNYRAYAMASDSAQVQRTNEQLNTLTKKYELNELRRENRAVRQRAAFFTFLIAVLAMSFLAYILYTRNLRRKEKALYEASLKIIKAEEAAEESLLDGKGDTEQSQEETLIADLLSLMQKEEVFKDAGLTREGLCKMLGTNRTYLSAAVASYSGKSVVDFVNHYRLRRAAETLSRDNTTSIIAIYEDAGFSSRATFNRKFQDEFGMSPTAYRAAAHRR